MRLFGNQGIDGLPKFSEYNTMNNMEEFEYHLIKMVFPNSSRAEVLNELDNKGINHSSVFPNLIGDFRKIK